MTVTYCIRYVLDPFKREAFETYASNCPTIIPACGGDLIGYFMPGAISKIIARRRRLGAAKFSITIVCASRKSCVIMR